MPGASRAESTDAFCHFVTIYGQAKGPFVTNRRPYGDFRVLPAAAESAYFYKKQKLMKYPVKLAR